MKKLLTMLSVVLMIALTLTSCVGSGESVDALNAQIDTLTKQLEDANAKIEALEADITDLNAQINSLNEENEELKALVEALRNCLKDIHSFSGGVCTACGKVKEDESSDLYTREGDYIYFGEYPQTIKADDVTVTDTTDSRGYYLGDDGNYYARVIANPYESSYTFSTGAGVTEGTEYYFKVEPIRWRILSEEDGAAFILCDSIIANVPYQSDYTYDSNTGLCYTTANGAPDGTYANNYKYSEVRAWLNATFYETAFNSLQQEIVLTTEVDNSAASTNPYGNETLWNNGVNDYACESTNDKIFLLSEAEATNDLYGFASYNESDTARRMLTSDYSRATGAWLDYYGNGWWRLRSPYCYLNYGARGVDSVGQASDDFNIINTIVGVVPALRIRL